MAALRDAPWLTGSRARAYFWVWLVLLLGVAGVMAHAFQAGSAAEGGKPVASDFMTFWSAARMAVLAVPAAAYDDTKRVALQHAAGAMGSDPGAHYAYWYPPPFLLVTWPLGLAGYVPALCGFMAVGFALLIACLRRLLPDPVGVAALVLSPVMLLNVVIGQNGAFTAACFGGAMLLLDRAPVLAGACLGFLVCKPHLALLIPVALAAAGRWRSFFACGAMAAALCGLSFVLLGTVVWRDFLTHAGEATATLQSYSPDWGKIQSVFTAVRLLGGGIGLAFAAQGVVALGAACVLALGVRGRPGPGPEVSLLVVAALIATPYMFDYDLACLLVPMAYLGAVALGGDWRPWEKLVLLVAYVLPIGARWAASTFGVPTIPLLLLALLAIFASREAVSAAPNRQKFFGSFFQKRTAFSGES